MPRTSSRFSFEIGSMRRARTDSCLSRARTSLGISTCARLTQPSPSCAPSALSRSSGSTKPSLVSTSPSVPPTSFWNANACSSCSWVTTPALTSRSPMRCLFFMPPPSRVVALPTNGHRGNYATGPEKSQGQSGPDLLDFGRMDPLPNAPPGALPRGVAARPSRRRHLRRLGGSGRAQAPARRSTASFSPARCRSARSSSASPARRSTTRRFAPARSRAIAGAGARHRALGGLRGAPGLPAAGVRRPGGLRRARRAPRGPRGRVRHRGAADLLSRAAPRPARHGRGRPRAAPAWLARRAAAAGGGWSSRSPSGATWPRRRRSAPPSAPGSPSGRSSASTTT